MDIAKNPGETETNQLPKAFHFHHGITHLSQEKSKMMEKLWGRLVLQSEEEGLDECAATRGLRRTFAERLLSVAGCSWEHWMTTWFVVVEKIIEQPLAESVELPFVGLLFPVPLLFTKKAMFRVFRVALRNQGTSWTRSISWSVPSWTRTLRSMRRWWHAWASSWKVGDVESQPE